MKQKWKNLVQGGVAVLLVSLFAGSAYAVDLGEDLDPSQGVYFRAFKQAKGPAAGKDLGDSGSDDGGYPINFYKGSLEAWVWSRSEKKFKLYKNFDIPIYAGNLGPKVRRGDHQAPEGFYKVSVLKTNSQYGNYALKYDYPNSHDRSKGWSGGDLEIHGGYKSDGCFAMGDDNKEIYDLARMAMQGGKKEVPVHIFPFPMTEENLEQVRGSKWSRFWENLKEGYDAFEATHLPPQVSSRGGEYAVKTVGTPAEIKPEIKNAEPGVSYDSARKADKKDPPLRVHTQANEAPTEEPAPQVKSEDIQPELRLDAPSCTSAVKAYFGAEENREKVREYLKVQSEITLHRIAWVYLKSRGEEADSLQGVQKSILELVAKRDPKLFGKFQAAPLDADKASRNAALLGILDELKQTVASDPANAPYLLKASDLKMVSLLVDVEKTYGNSAKDGVVDLINMISSSYRARAGMEKADQQAIERHLKRLNAKKEQFSADLEKYLSEQGCGQVARSPDCVESGGTMDMAKITAQLEESQSIQEALFAVLGDQKEEVRAANRWGNYWLRVGARPKLDTPVSVNSGKNH
jgi:murein L,D-transpeptidase YafK